MDQGNYGAPLSNLPPLAYLSGLSLGPVGLSGGVGGQGLSGTQRGGGGLGAPGAEGLGLDALSALLAAQSDAGLTGGPGTGVGLGAGIGGSLASPGYSLAGGGQAGAPGGGTGGYAQAGQNTVSPSVDPLSVIQKLLGTASKAAGAFGTGASPTLGDTGGTSLSDQVRSGGTPGGYGTAGATAGPGLQNEIAAGGAPPSDAFNPNAIGGYSVGTQPAPGTPGGFDQSFLNQILGQVGNPATGYAPWTSLQNFSPEAIAQFQQALAASEPGTASLNLIPGAGGVPGGADVLGQTDFGGGGLGGLAPYLSGLQGLLGAGQGFASGSPTGAIQGIQGIFQALQAANAAAQATSAGSAAIAASPALEAISGALSAAAAPAAVAAPFIQALVSYIGSQEESQARRSGYVNNPIRGGLYSAATQGLGNANQTLQAAQQAGLQNIPTEQLQGLLSYDVNNLLPYFNTAPGGVGPIRASEATGAPGNLTADQYTGQFQQAQQGVVGLVNELMNRGVTYEQLGQLPVTGNYVQQRVDAYNPLQDYYARGQAGFDAQANQLIQSALGDQAGAPNLAALGYAGVTPGQVTPQMLFQAAQGSAPYGPEQATNASGLITGMFGGPLWAALARTLPQDNPLVGQIQQHFNPWSQIGGFTGPQLQTALQPELQALQLQQLQNTMVGP